MLLVVPIHIVAFTLLFFGIMRLVEIEILNAHSLDARHLLEEAVEDLHPLMVGSEGEEIPGEVGEYADAHKLLDLKIYRTTGVEVGSPNHVDPEVSDFLAGREDELFRFERDGQNVTMHGMRRIRSEAECVECHVPASTLGAATMRLDLTDQMGAAHGSIRRNLAMLIAGWALLVGIVNIWLGRMTRRSMARLQLRESPQELSTRKTKDAPGLLLDPVSAELYESLRNFRENQQSLDAEVTSRLRRAEHMASLASLPRAWPMRSRTHLPAFEVLSNYCGTKPRMRSNAICSNRSSKSLIGSTEPFTRCSVLPDLRFPIGSRPMSVD